MRVANVLTAGLVCSFLVARAVPAAAQTDAAPAGASAPPTTEPVASAPATLGYSPDSGVSTPLSPPPMYWPYLPMPELRRRSTAAMVGGIVLSGAGALSIMYVGFTAAADCVSQCEERTRITRGVLIGGLVGIAIGVPLIIYGARHVPMSSAAYLKPLPKWAGAPSPTGWGWNF